MKTDDFENRLQRVAPREIPSAWREEILTAAQAAQSTRLPSNTTRPGFLSTLIHKFSTVLRPQRIAWAGLAAAWVVIGSLHLATSESSKTTSMTNATTPATPETLQVLKQQRLLYAELIDRPEQHPTERLKTCIPGPRSQRREETTAV